MKRLEFLAEVRAFVRIHAEEHAVASVEIHEPEMHAEDWSATVTISPEDSFVFRLHVCTGPFFGDPMIRQSDGHYVSLDGNGMYYELWCQSMDRIKAARRLPASVLALSALDGAQ